MLLGMQDFWTFLGFLLMILATVAAVVYGLVNWNKGGITRDEEEAEKRWMEEELELEEKVDGGVS